MRGALREPWARPVCKRKKKIRAHNRGTSTQTLPTYRYSHIVSERALHTLRLHRDGQ